VQKNNKTREINKKIDPIHIKNL